METNIQSRWALNRTRPAWYSIAEMALSPGPLHVSDLTVPQHISRPHKLEPLEQQQMQGSAEGAARKKKKTRRRREEESLERRGDLDGREGGSEEVEDPLLSASALQQMQARLDPLYNTATTTIAATASDTQLNCRTQSTVESAHILPLSLQLNFIAVQLSVLVPNLLQLGMICCTAVLHHTLLESDYHVVCV